MSGRRGRVCRGSASARGSPSAPTPGIRGRKSGGEKQRPRPRPSARSWRRRTRGGPHPPSAPGRRRGQGRVRGAGGAARKARTCLTGRLPACVLGRPPAALERPPSSGAGTRPSLSPPPPPPPSPPLSRAGTRGGRDCALRAPRGLGAGPGGLWGSPEDWGSSRTPSLTLQILSGRT